MVQGEPVPPPAEEGNFNRYAVASTSWDVEVKTLPFFATHYLRSKSEVGSQGPEARGLNTPMFQVTSLAGDAFTHLHASLQARNP